MFFCDAYLKIESFERDWKVLKGLKGKKKAWLSHA